MLKSVYSKIYGVEYQINVGEVRLTELQSTFASCQNSAMARLKNFYFDSDCVIFLK